MLEFIKYLLHFLHLHPYWAIFFSFLIACIESLAILGLFVPGSTILGLMGGLIGAHILSPAPIIIAAVIGAIVGDGISYWLGYRYHTPIRSVWPINRFPGLLKKGEKFFIKYGGTSVFFARFIGPLRPVMPLVAGIMRLSPIRFLIANVLSAMLWAPGYILIGILVGHQIVQMHPEHIFKFFSGITIGFIVFWFLYYVLRLQIIKLLKYISHKIKRGHGKMKSSFWKNFLKDRGVHAPANHQQVMILMTASILFFLFLVLVSLLLLHVSFETINQTLYHSLQGVSAPFAVSVMKAISLLGDRNYLVPISGVIFIYLFFTNQKRAAWHWLVLITLTILSLMFFKDLVHYPRPAQGAMMYTTHSVYSFPSGHVGTAIVFWGFLGFLLLQKIVTPRLQKDVIAVVVFIILSIVFSRLFLGMHWLTDIVGAILLASAYLSFFIFSYRRNHPL
jgi:membrane protein DedA with SNARE-associated domain/membrane-associated phospholipid phosphatase